MSASVETVQEETLVNIEINGVPLKARPGSMVIEAADAAGITIPRFCYHKKLSIAANCRMCLVEVEKVPKPLPACATPVSEGMKVYTESPKAIEAQQGTMEFLLINHPLDCPICDQGGECDLQEISIGYGSDHSSYMEKKRVVKDKDLGPLIATEMTRCIHCTRCVRFGEEIAGIRELGATGRGERTVIGTYVEQAVTSEMSGNVIDLCPVGALTSKPFRFTARAWELQRRPSIAPHDCIGSNVDILVRRNEVMRVDPHENEAINEVWLSDRDRFSYEAVNSEARLRVPMIKDNGQWRETDWSTALEFTVKGLKSALTAHGGERLGALLSPSSTLEEMYLARKLMSGLDCANIDHRLRQLDFSDQELSPVFPWLGHEIAELEQIEAALLVGSNVRKEQPIAAHRLRKAALRGGRMMFVNPVDYESNFPVHAKAIATPAGMERDLAAVCKALSGLSGDALPREVEKLFAGVKISDNHTAIAGQLMAANRATVLLGNQAFAHPAFSTLRSICVLIAKYSGARLGYLTEGANSSGAWLAGVVPHRDVGGKPRERPGLTARSMFEEGLKAYLLLNVEPEYDGASPAAARDALDHADFVVSMTPFTSKAQRGYADVLLPITPFTETSGTFVNAEGRWQSFTGTVAPLGEARPAWKVLRVLGNFFALDGFEYHSSAEIREEISRMVADIQPSNDVPSTWWPDSLSTETDALARIADVPLYAVDNVVRRAASLQETADARQQAITICEALAVRLGLQDASQAVARQGIHEVTLPLLIDEKVPDGCVLLSAALPCTAGMGMNGAPLELYKGETSPAGDAA